VHVDARLNGELGGEGRGRTSLERLGLDARPGSVRGDGEVRGEGQLLQTDQPSTFARRQSHALGQRGPVLGRIGVPAVLDGTDPQQARPPGPTWAYETPADAVSTFIASLCGAAPAG